MDGPTVLLAALLIFYGGFRLGLWAAWRDSTGGKNA